MDPITMQRLAIIRQQEFLAMAANDRLVTPPWHTLWRWLTARIHAVEPQSMQPTCVPARMGKQDA